MPQPAPSLSFVPAPASPCINVCVLDAGGLCSGCRRSSAEIAGWSRMSAAERWAVIERLRHRAHGTAAGP